MKVNFNVNSSALRANYFRTFPKVRKRLSGMKMY